MEFVFLGIFTVELILRLIVSGPKKFFSYQNDDFSWYLWRFENWEVYLVGKNRWKKQVLQGGNKTAVCEDNNGPMVKIV